VAKAGAAGLRPGECPNDCTGRAMTEHENSEQNKAVVIRFNRDVGPQFLKGTTIKMACAN